MDNSDIRAIRGTNTDGCAVSIKTVELGHLAQLAGWSNFNETADRTLRAQGLSLPTDYRSPVRRGQTTVWRVAPDRALIRSDTALGFESYDDLVVLDLSDARVCLTLEGTGVAGLLSRFIALDFSEMAFPVGTFAQTSLHHVGVLVDRQEHDLFLVVIPTTWSKSLLAFIEGHLRITV